MMLEQTSFVFGEIPNNPDVDEQDAADEERMSPVGRIAGRWPMDQFVNLDGNEKGRFTDGHPTGPAHTEDQSDTLHQRKQAIDERAGCGPQNVRLRDIADLPREIGPKFPFRIDSQVLQKISELRWQIEPGTHRLRQTGSERPPAHRYDVASHRGNAKASADVDRQAGFLDCAG